MHNEFVDRKHGNRAVTYPHKLLEPILEETYGVIVYQEQVMEAARVLAGFSLGQADILRRAMGKKKKEEMEEQREIFVNGCAKNDISTSNAEHIFNLINQFAKNDKDTGSTSIQIAVISERIKNLTEHFKTHKKDNHSRRGLLKMVSLRRKLLDYVREKDENRYKELIKRLEIRR